MANAELSVTLREKAGKGVARKLRAQGLVPAVVYGKGCDPCAITVEPKALETAISASTGWNTLLTLKGAKPVEDQVVVLKELKRHAIRLTMVSADFHVIDLNAKSSFMVPVTTIGTSAGEKAGGGLQLIRHELEVVCLPNVVPQAIEINVEALEIGDVVHINEVVAPEGVEIPYDLNYTVITITGHQAEEVDGDDEVAEADAEASGEE